MFIFRNKYSSIVWTLLRMYLGYQWITAGEKVTSSAWVGDKTGIAIDGFLKGAVAKSGGSHPSVAGWYAGFINSFALPNEKLFSYMVAYGELLVGIGLILGTFTAVALFFGAFMNLNYMLAGTTSTNPIMYTIAILLMIAGTNASIIGLDYYVQPMLKKYFNLNR